MADSFVFRCVSCGRIWYPGTDDGTCTDCGDRRGTLDVEYEPFPTRLDFGRAGSGLFRFLPLLPLKYDAPRPPLVIGDTPLIEVPRLASLLKISRLFVKDEGRNPSASMKDRATAVALAHAASIGRNTVVAASTGNAASSLALVAASMGMTAVIFVPARAPRPKLAQMLLAGARVVAVDGTYDQAFDLAAQASRRFGWYSRNTATNPYLAEGKKTCALEIAESLGWEAPTLVAVGVGDGCVFAAQHKGFTELVKAGLTKSRPRMIGVQAEGASPLAHAFQNGEYSTRPVVPATFADSIAVGVPRDEAKALRAARESHGALISVPDDLIREAMRLLAQLVGVFAEPAGAAGLAGLLMLASTGQLSQSDTAVVIVSGHGLKDTDGAMSAVKGQVISMGPDPEELDRVFEQFI